MATRTAMATPPRPYRFTVDEFEQLNLADVLGDNIRVELMDGEIIAMSPIGVPHASCVDNLARELILQLGRGYRVSVQNPVQLPPDSLPQPDVAVAQQRRYARHPEPGDVLIVIEVADSSLDYDRNWKFPRYAAAGIAEAWLADVNVGVIERHTKPGPNGYDIITPFRMGEVVTSTMLPGLAVPVAEVFA